MLKFLLILILVIYLLYKVGGFLFKIMFLGSPNYQQRSQNGYERNHRKAQDGNLNIDYVPKKERGEKTGKGFKGGDYVDFEEVK
jgi:uncharacterized protein YxeA